MFRTSQVVWGFAVLVAIALLVLGGGSAMGSAVLPDPEALPATMVAVVPAVPGARGRITLAELRHALLLKAVSEGRDSAPKPGGPEYEKSKLAVVKSLLSARLRGVLSRRIGAETDSKAEEQRAFQEFLDEFDERWRGRTVCAPDYAISRCSNGPAS